MGRKVVKVVNDKNIKYAVLWIRVSSREQKEGYSLDAQEDRVKNYCIRKGLTVIKQFTIVESSTRGERKEFYNMINFIKKYKDPVALVCDKVDMFSSDLANQLGGRYVEIKMQPLSFKEYFFAYPDFAQHFVKTKKDIMELNSPVGVYLRHPYKTNISLTSLFLSLIASFWISPLFSLYSLPS